MRNQNKKRKKYPLRATWYDRQFLEFLISYAQRFHFLEVFKDEMTLTRVYKK